MEDPGYNTEWNGDMTTPGCNWGEGFYCRYEKENNPEASGRVQTEPSFKGVSTEDKRREREEERGQRMKEGPEEKSQESR